jgi:chromatin remodeling complex protein RSC6
MSKRSTSNTTAPTTATTTTATTATTTTTAPTTATTTTTAPTTATTTTTAPTTATTTTTAPTTATTTTTTDVHLFESENEYNELQSELTKLQEQVSLCKNRLKKFYKLTCKEVTKASKNKKNSSKRSPTGFDKPCDVPLSLKTLLNINDGEQVARPIITKKIYEYIDSNNLRDTADKRVLRVNDNLAKALNLTSQEVKVINASTSPKDKSGLNFYNIQKYIKKMYTNVPVTTTTTKSVKASKSA